MKIAILTSDNQWFVSYAKELNTKLDSKLFYSHTNIEEKYDVVFILSYHRIVPLDFLNKNRHNVVIHASKLPNGKGWSPMFWQILEGKDEIPFTMFEASSGVDNGDIYMQKILKLTGYELHYELRKKQAQFTIEMCLEFVNNYKQYAIPKKQQGKETFYKKRTPKDSEIDIKKSIEEQFNLFRIVDNDEYPAFFYKNGKKYILKIEEA